MLDSYSKILCKWKNLANSSVFSKFILKKVEKRFYKDTSDIRVALSLENHNQSINGCSGYPLLGL